MSNNAITNVIPDYLANLSSADAGLGLEGAQDKVIIQRAKIIQAQANAELKGKFNEGDIIITPTNEVLAARPMDGIRLKAYPYLALNVTPIYRWNEYYWKNPHGFNLPYMDYDSKTEDPASPVARASSDFKGGTKKRAYVDPKTGQHIPDPKNNNAPALQEAIESYNFICVANDHPIETPFVVSLNSGEFQTGRRWLTALNSRYAGGKKMPIFACRYDWSIVSRPGKKGSWIGSDFNNPINGIPYVTDELYQRNKELFLAFQKAHEDKTLEMDRSNDDAGDAEGTIDVNALET